MTNFEQYLNPALGNLLRALKLDIEYIKGDGTYLFDEKGNSYLDFVGAYGALPFGHACEYMNNALKKSIDSGEATLTQPSSLVAAGELAKQLISIAPGNMHACYFTNSGAETVEASLKIAFASTGRRKIVTTVNAFHGKTLGALSATWNAQYQEDFFAPSNDFSAVPFGNAQALEKVFMEYGQEIAAFIVEPIQGEAGVIVPPEEYLKFAQSLCNKYGALFIVDEIQTGLGRAGSLFRSAEAGVEADVLLLSKALGGGVIPIGACLVNKRAYTETFSLKHSSTFAGNTLACRAGLATINRLLDNQQAIIRSVAKKGLQLKEGLRRIQEKLPGLIEIRGEGLLIGIELKIERESIEPRFGSYLSILNEQGSLAPVVASHMLNVHGIRLAPALNGGSTLRIEPPLTVKESEIQKLLEGLETTLAIVARRDTGALLSHLFCDGGFVAVNPDNQERQVNQLVQKEKSASPFAFLVHPLTVDDISSFDCSLAGYSQEALSAFQSTLLPLVEPFVASSMITDSKTGSEIYGEFIMIPKTAEQFVNDDGKKNKQVIETAIQIAHERGAQIVGLGAFTSIVTRGGVMLDSPLPITTGNSATMLVSVDATRACLEIRDKKLNDASVAIVGAAGSIGSSAARLYLVEAKSLSLIGNPASARSNKSRFVDTVLESLLYLQQTMINNDQVNIGPLARQITQDTRWGLACSSIDEMNRFAKALIEDNGKEIPLFWFNDASEGLPACELVFIATSNTERFITPELFRENAVVCDISRPANISLQLSETRPDVLLIDGGIVCSFNTTNLGANYGIAESSIYACMAETMALAFDKKYESTSTGIALKNDDLILIRNLIDKHGFELAAPTRFDQPIAI